MKIPEKLVRHEHGGRGIGYGGSARDDRPLLHSLQFINVQSSFYDSSFNGVNKELFGVNLALTIFTQSIPLS